MLTLNSLIFPKPVPQYDENTFPEYFCEIIQVERKQSKGGYLNLFMETCCNRADQESSTVNIPCLHMKRANPQAYVLYFHGNAEDLGYTYSFLMQVYQSFNVSIVAVEYPGYGIYRSNPKACQEEIELDAEAVYRYMVEEMKVAQSRIILFGRSMGSGPACFISSKFNPKAVILMSPFSSIRSVVVQHASILGYLLKNRFDNLQRAAHIYCPCLIVHGRSDTLISYHQSEQIYDNLKSSKKLKKFPLQMTHNDFDFHNDLKLSIDEFFQLAEAQELIIDSY